MPVLEPVDSHGDRRAQPEEHVDQIDPDSVLHALDILVALRVFLDEQLSIMLAQSHVSPETPRGWLTLPKMPNRTIQKKSSNISQTKNIDIFFIVTGIK